MFADMKITTKVPRKAKCKEHIPLGEVSMIMLCKNKVALINDKIPNQKCN